MLFFISSCQYFAGEHQAEKHTVILVQRHADGTCDVTLYADEKYISKVYVESCKIYIQTINHTDHKEK